MTEFTGKGEIELDPGIKVKYAPGKTFISADLPALNSWIILQNQKDRNRILQLPVLGHLLKYLGLRFLV